MRPHRTTKPLLAAAVASSRSSRDSYLYHSLSLFRSPPRPVGSRSGEPGRAAGRVRNMHPGRTAIMLLALLLTNREGGMHAPYEL
jgi:hypothetical protein